MVAGVIRAASSADEVVTLHLPPGGSSGVYSVAILVCLQII